MRAYGKPSPGFTDNLLTLGKILLPSMRNALADNLALLDSVHCHAVFYSTELAAKATELTSQCPTVGAFSVPTFEEMVTTEAKDFPYTKSWEDAKHDKVLICHTSGSTGGFIVHPNALG